MDWRYVLTTVPLLIATAISAWLAVYAWQRRPARGVAPFAVLMVAVALWSLGYVLELASGSLPTKIFWAKLQYLGIVTIPMAWLALALEYTGRERWVSARTLLLGCLIPLTTLLLVWTNDAHGLIWREIGLDTSGSPSMLVMPYGPWFWVHTAYSYLLMLTGTMLIASAVVRAPQLYRRQARILLVGALIPWLWNGLVLLSRSSLLPYLNLDLTPFGFTLTGLVLAWGLFRYQLLDIVPVARDAVVDSMGDGVIVLDVRDRVVDLNPAAQQIAGIGTTEAVGQPANEVLAAVPELAKGCQEMTEGQQEIALGEGEAGRSFDLQISPLQDQRGRPRGRLVVLHDITERKRAAAALEASQHFLQGVFDAIQDGISVLDSDLNVVRVNHWMETMYAEQAPLVGRKCFEVYHRRDSVCPWCPSVVTLETGEAHSGIVPYRPAEHQAGWIELSAFPLTAADGSVAGIIEYVKDISERIQTEQALQERGAQLEALRQMGLELASQLDLDSLLQSIVSRAVELLGGNTGGLYLYDAQRDALELAVAIGAEAEPAGTALKPGEGLAGIVWERGEAITVKDYSHWEGRTAVHGDRGFRATVGVPVRWGAGALGVLSVLADEPGVFSESDAELLGLFATQAAIAVHNARLFDETRRRNRELAALNHVIAASVAGQGAEAILHVACRELARALGVPQAVAGLLNEKHTEAAVVAEFQVDAQPSLVGQIVAIENDPMAQILLEEGQPVVLDAAQTDARMAAVRYLTEQRGVTSLLLLPLVAEGESMGALVLGDVVARRFSREEVALAQRVAEQVSGALARVRLAQNQRRLSAAVEQAADAIVITGIDGTILYGNPAFERMVHLGRGEFIGRLPSVFGSYRLEDTSHQEMWDAIRSGAVWQGRLEYKAKDDSLRTMDMTVAPVRNPAGEIVNFVATMRDMTREIQLEREIQQAQKMEALGRLAGGIAHDFNNLLTVIQLSTHLLQRKLDPASPLWGHTVHIRETSERAACLTKQLLSFSRRDVAEPRVLDLNVIVAELSPMLERIIGEQIELSTSLADDLWSLRADPGQMDQVIMNLALNARDAMPSGGTMALETANVVLDEAYAELTMDAQAGEHVRLTIRDTGTGMDDEVQKHLFEPFYTTKRQGEGTGLGLATVFGIVKYNGGHIQVSSEVGQGTTIDIYFPRAGSRAISVAVQELETGPELQAITPSGEEPARAAPEPPAATPAEPQPQSAPPPPTRRPQAPGPRGTETVLVVEDEQMVRDQAALVLKSFGYRVLVAGDGEEALEVSRATTEPIHLLLTDMIMPRMSGTELAEALARERPETRVLYMSGYTGDEMTHEGLVADGAAFLPKPFSLASLTEKVRAVLDG